MTQPASTRGDGVPERRKATLFCWECDHASPIDGDWQVRSRERHVAYVCPSCETTLSKRPRHTDPSPARAPTPLAAWRRALRTSATVWRASIDIGLSSLTALVGVGVVAGSQYRSETE
ncbi:hypothetical protein [Natrinema versiforme]|uniref:DUF8106 domain-containing protein n=1 Tax=Natrinema versiforme JCM 10478 TaxID=1227496 RepID=L9Y3X9_9EURY|nr:hypothetical protein [Natrinema versiforme]ELY67563.1 hypothetical protein C489_10744 [Natrinema versiforme JCM 10478]